MEYRQLGRSGLKVSLLTLGTMTFGGESFFAKTGSGGVAEAGRMIDMAVDHGVNMLDTANVYSFGKCESILGEALKGRSQDLMVTTKVRFGMSDGPNAGGLSRLHIVEQCEASLKRLGRSHIDVYLMHEWDGLTPLDESLGAMDQLVQQGKVRYIGCSNFSAWHVMKGLMISQTSGLERLVAQQIHYTLEAREAEYELLPIAVDQGVGIMVWSPIAGGLLSGKFRRNAPVPKDSRHALNWGEPPVYDEERLYRIIDVLLKIADGRGVSAAQVALAWLASRPGVATIVVGARKEEQLKDNLASASLKLGADELAELEKVSQKPLPYPYWHQLNTASDRFGAADLALHQPFLSQKQPRA